VIWRLIKKSVWIPVFLVLLVGVSYLSFEFGYSRGQEKPKNIQLSDISGFKNPSGVIADFGTFWQAWDLINNYHLKNDKITSQDKVYGAISGLVSSLDDPYSDFFSPEDGKKFEEDVNGYFGGVGIQLGIVDDVLTAIAPLKNTPAQRAGIMAGDSILAVNNTSTQGMSLDDAILLIRGPEGSEVVLTIFRKGWDRTKDFKLTREEIVVPTLDYEKIGNIGRIQLYSFNLNATREFYNALLKARDDGVSGLIIDLRDNPGGYLDVAVEIASWFVPKGEDVVKEVAKDDEVLEDIKSYGPGTLKDFPVVILLNKGSASASEILAGALRDNLKTPIVGERSFGKGTVQEIKDLRDGSSLKITIAHWVMPSGKILEGEGIDPDYKVELTEKDIEDKKDPQLDKALEVMKGIIKK